ncbi:hypothetical protein [Lonsdalea quercina]|uniref:hypothetical protein n=1 Tax=Lonsdalea quercina TaxID=71657 RepID=UPI0039758507
MTAEIWVKNKNLLQNRVIGQGDFCAKHVLYLHDIISSVGARRGRVKASLPLAGHWNSSPLAFSVVFGKAKKVKKAEKMQYLFLRLSLLIRLGSAS